MLIPISIGLLHLQRRWLGRELLSVLMSEFRCASSGILEVSYQVYVRDSGRKEGFLRSIEI